MSFSLFQGIVFLILSLLFSSVLGWVVRFAYERLALFFLLWGSFLSRQSTR